MWLSNSKKYATDRFLEERASSGSVHHVVRHGMAEKRSAWPSNGIVDVVGIFGWVLQGLGRVLFRSGLSGILPLRLNWRSLRGVVGLCVR